MDFKREMYVNTRMNYKYVDMIFDMLCIVNILWYWKKWLKKMINIHIIHEILVYWYLQHEY